MFLQDSLKSIAFRALLILLFTLLALPASADDWLVRGHAAWFSPDSESDFYEAEGDLGLQVAVERRLSRFAGLELGAFWGTSGLSVEATSRDRLFRNELEVDSPAVTAAVNFHLNRDWPVDVYAGPLVAYIDFSDVSVTGTVEENGVVTSSLNWQRETEDEVALGVQLGADFQARDGRWGLGLSVRYLDTDLRIVDLGGQTDAVDFDPIIFGTGLSYRF